MYVYMMKLTNETGIPCSHLCSNLQPRSHRLHSTAMERKRLPGQPASKEPARNPMVRVKMKSCINFLFFNVTSDYRTRSWILCRCQKRGTVRWWHFRDVVRNKILSNRPLDSCPVCFNLAKVGKNSGLFKFFIPKRWIFKMIEYFWIS